MLYDTAIFMLLIFAIDVEIDVMPWLMAETKKIMDKRVVARLLLDGKYSTVRHACTYWSKLLFSFMQLTTVYVI